jgi:hypothetical protein
VSNINYLNIEERFPVSGQDNDTQTFRDNFDAIKTGLRVAQEEITLLEDNTARTDQDTNFNKFEIVNSVMRDIRERAVPGGDYNGQGIDFRSGSYQIFNIVNNANLFFQNLPGDPLIVDETNSVGKMTVELYAAATGETSPPYTVTFTTSGGAVVKKSGFPVVESGDFVITSTADPIILEIWRRKAGTAADYIFIRYVGQFS